MTAPMYNPPYDDVYVGPIGPPPLPSVGELQDHQHGRRARHNEDYKAILTTERFTLLTVAWEAIRDGREVTLTLSPTGDTLHVLPAPPDGQE